MLPGPWPKSVSFLCPTSAAVLPFWVDSRATGPSCISLALRQASQHGVVVCVDAHGRQQLEMPFRLLLREDAALYFFFQRMAKFQMT